MEGSTPDISSSKSLPFSGAGTLSSHCDANSRIYTTLTHTRYNRCACPLIEQLSALTSHRATQTHTRCPMPLLIEHTLLHRTTNFKYLAPNICKPLQPILNFYDICCMTQFLPHCSGSPVNSKHALLSITIGIEFPARNQLFTSFQ